MWDVEGAAEPQVLGLPGSLPAVPTVHRQGGSWDTGSVSQGACPTPCQPIPGLPLPLGFRGLRLPSPIPGSTPSHLKQAKHRQRCLRVGVGVRARV